MKLGDFLTQQFALVGVKVEDEHLGELLKDETIFKAEINDELAGKLSTGLFTKDAAVNNPEIRKELGQAFKAQALGSVDDKLKAHSNTNIPGFWEELEKADGTYTRVDLFVEKLLEGHKAALVEAKENSKNPVDTKKLQDEIEGLNGQLLSIKEGQVPKTEMEEMKKSYESQLDSHAINNLFSSYKWANDKIDAGTQTKMASAFFREHLSTNELTLARENGSTKLMTKDGTEYFVDNKKVSPRELTDKLMAENGFLANSNSGEEQSSEQSETPQLDATEAQERANKLANQFVTPTA